MGASKGLGRAIGAALAREGARVAVASRARRADRRGGCRDRGRHRRRGARVRGRHRRPRPAAGAGRGGHTRARPGRDPRDEYGRAAPRRLARVQPRRLGGRAPRARAGAHDPRGGGGACDARGGVGEDRERDLDRDQGADPGPDPLEQPPSGRGRGLQDDLPRRSPAKASSSTASRRGGLRRTASRASRANRSTRSPISLRATSRSAGSGAWRSSRTWWPSSARRVPPTYAGSTCRSTAALRGAYEGAAPSARVRNATQAPIHGTFGLDSPVGYCRFPCLSVLPEGQGASRTPAVTPLEAPGHDRPGASLSGGSPPLRTTAPPALLRSARTQLREPTRHNRPMDVPVDPGPEQVCRLAYERYIVVDQRQRGPFATPAASVVRQSMRSTGLASVVVPRAGVS